MPKKAASPENTDPLFDRRNVIKTSVICLLGMAAGACILFAPYVPLYVRLTLTLLNFGITNFAANLNLHLPSIGVPAPQMNVENAPNMTVTNNPAPPPDPRPDQSSDRAAAVNQPAIGHRTVYVPTRDAKGHYARATPTRPPGLDVHTDH